jgi:hypothetical protein
MELMLAILEIIQGVVSTIMNSAGFGTPQATILPQEIVTAVEDCGFFESIPLMGGYAHRRTVRVGALIRNDPERLRTVLQNVYVHGNRTGSAFHLCR